MSVTGWGSGKKTSPKSPNDQSDPGENNTKKKNPLNSLASERGRTNNNILPCTVT